MSEEKKRNEITAAQAMRFIMSIQFGVGVLPLPKYVSEYAGQDGWISVIIGGIIVTIGLLFINMLTARFIDESIFEINKRVFGKYLGWVLNLVLFLYLILATTINLRYVVFRVFVWFFRSTPLFVLTVLLLIPTVYLVANGLKVICRFNIQIYLVFFVAVIFMIINLYNVRITFLKPYMTAPPVDLLKGAYYSGFSFMGFETLLFIYPYIKNKNKVIRYTLGGSLTVTILYTFVTIVTIGVLGKEYMSKSVLPVLSLSRIVKFPVFERVDLYVLAFWIIALALCIHAYLFCSLDAAKKVLHIKKNHMLLGVLTVAIVLLSSFTDDANVIFKLSSYIGMASYGVGILFPVIVLLAALITGKKGVKKDA